MTFIQPLDPPPSKAAGTLGEGAARVSVAQRDGRSYLDERYFSDPYRIFTPQAAPDEPVSIVLSTLSGGLVGGDRLSFDGRVKNGAAAQFVGQAAEKVYGSAGPTTHLGYRLSAEAGAWLEQVPQETYKALSADADLMREATAHLSKLPAQGSSVGGSVCTVRARGICRTAYSP